MKTLKLNNEGTLKEYKSGLANIIKNGAHIGITHLEQVKLEGNEYYVPAAFSRKFWWFDAA